MLLLIICGSCLSLSGYLLFPLFLLAAYLGGAWSNWSTGNSAFLVRLLAFTVSPIVLLAAVLVRVRCVHSVPSGFTALNDSTSLARRTSKMQFF